jgi:ribosomal protein S30
VNRDPLRKTISLTKAGKILTKKDSQERKIKQKERKKEVAAAAA